MTKTVKFGRQSPVSFQQILPHKRPSVRTRLSTLSTQKKQSTLTQIDFVSTPSDCQCIVLDSGDEDEYADPRPAKRPNICRSARRKKAATRSESQSTLTQKWEQQRSNGMVVEDSEEEIDAQSEDNSNNCAVAAKPASSVRSERVRAPLLVDSNINQEEHLGTARSNSIQSSESSHADAQDTRVFQTTATPNADPRTPQTIQREVPSSETHSSVKLSTSISQRYSKALRQSPLASRSARTDSGPSTKSSQFQCGIEREKFEGMSSPFSSKMPTRGNAELHRTTFVQDSEDEASEGLEELNMPHENTFDRYSGNAYATTQCHLTYNPVSAALDRDAARFAQRSQTHGLLFDPQIIERNNDESEQQLLRELNAPFGSPPESTNERAVSDLSQSTASGSPDGHAELNMSRIAAGPNRRPPDSEDANQIGAIPDSHILVSSPTILRPSQISTVASSSNDINVRAGPLIDDEKVIVPSDPISMIWQETLSSPVYEMLPLDSEEHETRTAHAVDWNHAILSSDGTDFSLPPPPSSFFK